METKTPKYATLRAEIARKGLKHDDVARIAGIKPNTLANKLAGNTEFKLSEALSIWTELFPEMDIIELFKKEV